MGLRFQRRIGFPGGRVNLSESGVSVSLGVRGAHATIGKTPRVTVGLPGSGLSYTKIMPWSRRRGGRTGSGLGRFIGRLIGLAIAIGFFIACFG